MNRISLQLQRTHSRFHSYFQSREYWLRFRSVISGILQELPVSRVITRKRWKQVIRWFVMCMAVKNGRNRTKKWTREKWCPVSLLFHTDDSKKSSLGLIWTPKGLTVQETNSEQTRGLGSSVPTIIADIPQYLLISWWLENIPQYCRWGPRKELWVSQPGSKYQSQRDIHCQIPSDQWIWYQGKSQSIVSRTILTPECDNSTIHRSIHLQICW